MGKPLFTPEELAELAAFDAEIDETDITKDEIVASRARDREAVLSGMSKREKKIAEAHRAYYEANREKWNAYMREYRKRRKANGQAQDEHHHPDSAGRV